MKKTTMTIKSQLILGFLCPILFIIIVGAISYQRASSGMIDNYKTSALSTVEMSMACLDQAFKPLVTSAVNLGGDTQILNYGMGAYDKKTSQVNTVSKEISAKLFAVQATDEFVHNIHIIPFGSQNIITTENMQTGSGRTPFISQIEDSDAESAILSEQGIIWGGLHALTDEKLKLSSESYFMYCGFRLGTGTNSGLLLIDADSKSILALMEKMDFGPESQIIFRSPDGRSLNLGAQYETERASFYEEALSNMDAGSSFTADVNHNSTDFFFIMKKSSLTGSTLSVMIPKDTVTTKADSIKNLTIFMVLLASAVAFIIGLIIIVNISANITRSVKQLNEVASGNLSISSYKSRRDEFGKIQSAIAGTVTNTRQLIEAVLATIGQVSSSSEEIGEAVDEFSLMTEKMGSEMEEISTNIDGEADEISTCHTQMDDLSSHIKTVNKNTGEVSGYIEDTRDSIRQGLDSMDRIIEHSKSTYDVTAHVRQQVDLLAKRLNDMEGFVDSIKGIAGQTRMLSLNATIEAARVGQEGAGFGVVAEQIRKLSDESAIAASDIHTLISEVQSYAFSAAETVQSAENIVALQENAVQDTFSLFHCISGNMEKFITNIEEVSSHMEDIDKKRHTVTHSMDRILESSQESVSSGAQIRQSLSDQAACSRRLSDTADSLTLHIKELEDAIASFRL